MSQRTMEKRILVVDDDQAILDVVQEILTGEGYRVQTSLNSACLQHLENDPPGLILLDVLLWGEDGRELCRQVKGREQTRQIPVILFSAHVAANSATAACGADDFLAKPFRMGELLDLVAKRITPRQQDLN
jgi:CheY-like chemotaxis protein